MKSDIAMWILALRTSGGNDLLGNGADFLRKGTFLSRPIIGLDGDVVRLSFDKAAQGKLLDISDVNLGAVFPGSRSVIDLVPRDVRFFVRGPGQLYLPYLFA